MSDSRVTPAWNFKGMLMENNSRVITNADATLTQKIYDYGEVSPEQSSVTVVKDDDMAHFYFNICSEKGEPAYIKITKDDDGNIVITGTDHSGTTQQTILASKIELTENDKGVLISVLATENGELIKKEAQVYDSTISVEEKDYGALVTMTNSKGTSSEAKLYSPTISAERLEDNTGVKIIITSGKEGATPTVVNLYDPIVTGKRVTGGAEITIQNHIDEEPQIINLYDAGSSSIAPEYDETQEYKKFNYCIYNNTMYVCLEDTTGPFDETKWQETKVSYELNNVSLKIVAEDWDGSKIYSIGDYVMYDKILYKCISNEEGSKTAYPNITTSKWETIFIMDEIPNIATTEKAGIVKVGNNLEITEDGTLNAKAGGGNANEMELTWAEYLALTDEEKNNGTTYYITDKNPTSSEKGFKSTLLATLNDQPQEIDFSNYDLILYQAYNSEVNLYSSAVFMPSFINRAGNIILSIDVTDRIIIDSTNAITLNAFNCVIDVYGMNFVGSGGECGSGLSEKYHNYSTDEQIVGTWIDGRNVYEKVINMENATWSQEIIIQENVDIIVEENLYYSDSTLQNGSFIPCKGFPQINYWFYSHLTYLRSDNNLIFRLDKCDGTLTIKGVIKYVKLENIQ